MIRLAKPRLAAVALALLSALVLASCAGTDAVSTGGGTFDFVSPGGQTEIRYDPPSERGTIGTLAGDDLMNPGETIGVDDFADQVVVLNVWGSWCGPCRVEAPDLEKVQAATKDQGVQFLGINVRDNSRAAAQDFATSYDLSYPSIYDPKMRSLIALGRFPTSVIPVTIILDREHRVAAVFLKSVTADELQPVVEEIAAGSKVAGSDAVSTGGGTFDFVSPTGETEIRYDPPSDRDFIGALAGDGLMNPGATIGVDDFADQVVVLNVWGSWCGPCRVEASELEKVQAATKDQGVQFLGINVRDNSRAAAQDFATSYDLSYPSIYDPKMRSLIALGRFPTSVVPVTIILDREHRVAAVFLKSVTADELQTVVEQIAAEK